MLEKVQKSDYKIHLTHKNMFTIADFKESKQQSNVVIFNSKRDTNKLDFVKHYAAKFDCASMICCHFKILDSVPLKNQEVIVIILDDIVDLVSLLALTRIYQDKIFVIDFYRNEDLPEIDGVTVYNMIDRVETSLT